MSWSCYTGYTIIIPEIVLPGVGLLAPPTAPQPRLLVGGDQDEQVQASADWGEKLNENSLDIKIIT